MATIPELTAEIKELSIVIQEAKERLIQLQAGLANPELVGSGAIPRVIADIEKLNAIIATSSERQATLINEQRNLAAIQSVDKAITTLKEKLATQTGKRQDLVNVAGDEAELKALDRQIQVTTSALKSFENRKANAANVRLYNEELDASGRLAPTRIPGGALATPPKDPEVSNVAGKAAALEASSNETKRLKLIQEAEAARKLENEALIRGVSELNLTVAQEEVVLNILKQQVLERTKLKVQTTEGGANAIVTARETTPSGGIRETRVAVDQFGQVTNAVGRQFQSFSQGIARNFIELTKWSTAMALLYAPLNALSNMLQKMVSNQVKLAEASIAVNDSVASQGNIFSAAAAGARAAGEDIGGVIDAFDLAFRATGKLVNETERFTTATKLMNDSLTLSKLSSFDQAQANDTLSAALFQSGMQLTEGVTLLDQWVRVSKIANVDVATLADGVAILGDSAELAGLSTKQLNALIATLAETSKLSGATAANAAKALIGTYQSPEAEKALNRIGVSVKDQTGNVRDFLSVMTDVANLINSGVLSGQALSQVTLAIGGGGIRNQKNVSAFLSNFQEYNRIATSQENVQGESAAALAKQLDTVQTAITRLGNAFQQLGQALGSKGGLLDDFAKLIDFGTSLVDMLTRITEVLGKAGPLLYGVGIASLVAGSKGPVGSILSQFNPFAGAGLAGTLGGGRTVQAGQGLGGGTGTGGMLFAPGINQAALGKAIQSTILSSLAIAIPAAQNIGNKDYTEAGANIVGGLIGAFTGGPAGALIGASIAEAFVRATIDYKPEFVNFFAGAVKPPEQVPPETPSTTQELTKKAFESIGGGEGMGWLGQFIAKNREVFGNNLPGFSTEKKAFNTPEAAALDILKTQNPDLYEKIKLQGLAEGVPQTKGELTPVQKIQSTIADSQTQELLKQLQGSRIKEITAQAAEGKIKPADFAAQTQAITGYTTVAIKYMADFGDAFKEINPKIKSTKEEYQAFLDLMAYGNPEQVASINATIADIEKLQNVLAEAKKSGKWDIPITISGQETNLTGEAQGNTLLANLQRQAAAQATSGYQTGLLSQVQLPPIVGSTTQPTRPQDLQYIIAETKKAQEAFFASKGGGGLDQNTINALEQSFDKFSVLVGDAGHTWYETVEGVDQKFYTDITKAAEEAGKILTQQNVGFQNYDVSRPELDAAVAKANAMAQNIHAKYPEFVPQNEEVIAQTTDGIVAPIHADMRILSILLQQLNDKAQKQLDGMYNIPEGATFWVPITAAYYRPQDKGTGLDLSALDAALNPNTTETNKNTVALIALTNKLGGDLPILGGDKTPLGTRTPQGMWPNPSKGEEPWQTNPDFLNQTAHPKTPYVDIYGRPLTGPGGGNKTTPYDERGAAIGEATTSAQSNDIFQQISKLFGSIAELEKPLYSESGKGKIDTNMEAITNFLNTLSSFFSGGPQGIGAGGGRLPSTTIPAGQTLPMGDQGTPVSTKLDLRIDSTTSLMVDGRVLAQIIKPYLAADLLQAQQTQSSVTRSYVI